MKQPTKNTELIAKITKELMSMVLHNKETFKRVVGLERQRSPNADYADFIQNAIDRLRRDIGQN